MDAAQGASSLAGSAPSRSPVRHPLEIVEFDEIGALIRYIGDRKTPRSDHRTRRAADHPGAGAGLHGARLRPGTHQGHRAGAGAVPPPHLPARRHQVPRRRWCSATRPTTGARGPTGSANPSPVSATCSAKASANPCASAAAGCPTRPSKHLEAFVTGATPPSRPGTVHTFPGSRQCIDSAPGGAA